MPGIDRPGRGLTLLDAAIGTRLLALGLDLARDDPALWVVDRPEAVANLHRLDVRAGSDVVLTATFGANRAWLDRYGRSAEVSAINRAAVSLARDAAGPDRLVLGSIGPTAIGDDLRHQAEALASGGVDALVLETHRLDQALAALAVLRPAFDLPVVASLFVPANGDGWRRLEAAGTAAIGVNCVLGMAEAAYVAAMIREFSRLPIWVKPSAGLPGAIASPEAFAASASRLTELGPVFVGGCCGTTDAHVSALRHLIDRTQG